MISKSDARLDIRLPSELRQRLSVEAARDNRTMASVVIIAIKAYLKKKEKAE